MDQLECSTSTSKKSTEGRKIMVTPETIRKVRLDSKKGSSHRSIAKKRGIDRKTVKAILEKDDVEFRYPTRKKQEFPKLENFKENLEELLKSRQELPKKKRCKFTRLFENIVELGYEGGYDSVRRYCTSWLREHEDVSSDSGCVPMGFYPAEAFQFDWTAESVIINGVIQSIKVGVMTLCHSRMSYIRAYPNEQTEMVLDFHVKAFSFFGGSCENGIYDNMKTAVKKVLRGKDRIWQAKLNLLSYHYLFELDACTPGKPQEKGMVERRVQTLQEDCFRPVPKCSSLDELNESLENDCLNRARTRQHPELNDKSVWDVFLEEQKSLTSFKHDFDGYVDKECRVSKTQLVQYDKNKYSVPLNNPKLVNVRAYAEHLVFLYKGKVVATHKRVFGRNNIVTNFEHYLTALERKPGAIKNGIPFRETNLPSPVVELHHRMKESYKDADRQFVDVLCAVKEFGLDDVVSACELALESSLASKDAVLNILYRTKSGPQIDKIEEAEHLKLSNPPSNDCSEYNNLLEGEYHEQKGASL